MAQLLLVAASAASSAAASTTAAFAANTATRLLFGPKKRRVTGARLDQLPVQSSTEGAGIIRLYGRMRIAGQIVWASNFKEETSETVTRAGKGARLGTKTTTTEYLYSVSLAIGLCEGVATRISRAYADGKPFDLSKIIWRFYRGDEAQAADPLIEAVERAPAPAFRGLSYVVFEDLALRDFGNRIPQFTFEIERSLADADSAALETAATALAVIPASGEFVYGTTPARRLEREGVVVAENQHAAADATDFSVSLEAAAKTFANLSAVSLAVAWFGTNLDAGLCELRPGVDAAVKITEPYLWRAGGVEREAAHLISQIDGAAAYGGTPADRAVIEALRALNARGLAVLFHPFLLMDTSGYPWRGRINVGADDKTAGAAAKIMHFFGAARAADFSVNGDEISYHGPNEWSFRRFILHSAYLCAVAGGVESFILGSELVSVTTARDGAASYPAVAAMRALAAEVRVILGPGVKISYGADWTEWRGHQPADGSGDVFFHLDPFWSDATVDFIGVDMYAPKADWRDGFAHADAAAGYKGPHDITYLDANIEGGEGFDWYYGSAADRAAQIRRPITDCAYGEPWLFRPKDLRNWWANPHYNRAAGVRTSAPTSWVPQSKPIRFTEFGCGAVDKGANAPNVFSDPKSVEDGLPYFSTGARDDLAQRRMIEAELAHWRRAEHNPVSSVYGGPMLAADRVYLYAWDARPFPYFPALADIWGDGPAYARGHWLNGRAGRAPLSRLVEAIAIEGGAESVDASALEGLVSGYAIGRPAPAREALEPFADAFAFDLMEAEDGLIFTPQAENPVAAYVEADLVAEEGGPVEARLAQAEDQPTAVRLSYLDEGADFRPAVAEARTALIGRRREAEIDLGAAMTPDEATSLAAARLAATYPQRETVTFSLPPSALAVEAGDVVSLSGRAYRVTSIEDRSARRIEATRVAPSIAAAPTLRAMTPPARALLFGPPLALSFETPLLGDEPPGFWFAAFAAPWPGAVVLEEAGANLTLATQRATIGRLIDAAPPASSGRFDARALRVKLSYGAFESVDEATLRAGANLLAVETSAGYEVLQFETATLDEDGAWTLRRLLRGQSGTEAAAASGAVAGARVILLSGALARAQIGAGRLGATLALDAAPDGAGFNDANTVSQTLTYKAQSLAPLSPVHLKAERSSTGLTLSWIRRTRLPGDWWDAEAPLGEAYERYRVRIYDGATLKREVDVPAPSYFYPSADIFADFGAIAPGPSAAFEVAQCSDLVGPGAAARLGFR